MEGYQVDLCQRFKFRAQLGNSEQITLWRGFRQYKLLLLVF